MNLHIKPAKLLWLLSMLSANVMAQSPAAPVGKWEGKLVLPQTSLRIFVEVKDGGNGNLVSKMASPDQGANNIPVSGTIWKNDSLILSVDAVQGEFRGRLSDDRTTINGIWKQGAGQMPLILKKAEVLQLYPKRSQEPQKPYPYKEEEIVYTNKKVGNSLGATLTLPEGAGPFPAAILISGSGPQDRNEELMGHKPFLVIADYLTKRGIAVLRVDDRGMGKSTGDVRTATSEDNASDVMASLEYLKSRKEIDAKRIGLIGHSEGGMIAPMVASQTSDVAFEVLLAGVGLHGDALYRRQFEDVVRISGTPEADVKRALTVLDKLLMVVKTKKTDASVWDDFQQILNQEGPDMAEKLKATAEAMSMPWFRYFLNFNPEVYLQKVKCPTLALNGSKDIQVSARENLQAIESALKAGGNKNVTVKELPGLNHLFQTAQTGSVMEYSRIDETFSPAALKIMGDWISNVTHK